jgi:hypothetical protein
MKEFYKQIDRESRGTSISDERGSELSGSRSGYFTLHESFRAD